MKRLCLITFLTLSAIAGIGDACAAPSEPRFALVIGNSAYRNAPPLKNPINDAREMAKALQELGFSVIRVENGTKQQLDHAIGQFSAKLAQGSVGLFYYSGHGIQENGHNYMIPVDAELAHESSVMLETVDIDVVLQLMNMAQTRLNLVILDACRSNPFERRFRALGRGLAPIDQAPQGTLVAYSTSPGKVAFDGDGANGLYTAELLKAIRVPGLKVEEVFKTVRIAVSKASDEDQIPWEMSSLTGDFYFRPPGSALPLAASEPAAIQPATSAATALSARPSPPSPQAALLNSPAAPLASKSADEIAFHCPAPGTVVQYSSGVTLTFAGANGFRCAYTDQSGYTAEKIAAFGDDAKLLDGLSKLWPLKIGREQRMTINVSGGFATDRFTVLREESVSVPAGTFDTLVVEQIEDAGTRSVKRVYWFATALGVIVKSRYAELSDTGRRDTFALALPSLVSGDYQALRIIGP
jgi:hypothetical protein